MRVEVVAPAAAKTFPVFRSIANLNYGALLSTRWCLPRLTFFLWGRSTRPQAPLLPFFLRYKRYATRRRGTLIRAGSERAPSWEGRAVYVVGAPLVLPVTARSCRRIAGSGEVRWFLYVDGERGVVENLDAGRPNATANEMPSTHFRCVFYQGPVLG